MESSRVVVTVRGSSTVSTSRSIQLRQVIALFARPRLFLLRIVTTSLQQPSRRNASLSLFQSDFLISARPLFCLLLAGASLPYLSLSLFSSCRYGLLLLLELHDYAFPSYSKRGCDSALFGMSFALSGPHTSFSIFVAMQITLFFSSFAFLPFFINRQSHSNTLRCRQTACSIRAPRSASPVPHGVAPAVTRSHDARAL